MDTMVKKTCLDDSFESQKKAAHAVANGLLAKEIRAEKTSTVSISDQRKALARGRSFAKRYGI